MNPTPKTSRSERRRDCILALFFLVLGALGCMAQTPEPSYPGVQASPLRPHLDPFPAEQNWSFLADGSMRTDPLDKLKYLQWGASKQQYVSLGFESREEYEYFDNWMFGAGPQDPNGYGLIRLMPHLDVHDGPDLRLFTEMTFNYVPGRNGGARPNLDEDKGDFHQGFLEIGPHTSREDGSSVRLGRQEIVLGSGRLFDNNEGPNVKLSFDGARSITQTEQMRWDNFIAKPVQNNTGFFDDVPNHAQTTWGSYLTTHSPVLRRDGLDLYYLGLATANASYNRGSANELRHTVGIRAFRDAHSGVDYNWEWNYQFGSFGSDRVRAWSISTESGYTFANLRFSPRPLLRVDAYSGDQNPAGRSLGTYNTYFPRGAYFSPKAVPFLGNQNLVDLHPQVQFHLRPNLTGEVGGSWYWRESTQDGVYAFGSEALLAPSSANHARFLGSQGDMELRWSPVAHIVTAFNVAGFAPSGFLNTTPHHRSPITANLGVTYRF
ncbi:alginate export family protein [Silvibacterium sp.]|uniref:alginate export family protein n=1 Tax=Silvibacterium sp. TaxID=1964179 RepID=UPI0039E52E0A